MLTKFRFEDLEVWQKAILLAKNIYQITDSFPKSEKYNLVSQLKRASTSISCNIAEGTARSSNLDKAKFTNIAYSSLYEVVSLLELSLNLDLIDSDTNNKLKCDLEIIAKMLSGLRKAQLKSKKL